VATGTPTRTPTPLSTPGRIGTTANPGDVIIAELHFLSGSGGEWVELFNTLSVPLLLTGWSIEDNNDDDVVPTIAIPSKGLAVLAPSLDLFGEFPDIGTHVSIIEDGRLGNGLNDTGDRLILRDGSGRIIDAVSYGSDASLWALPLPQGGSRPYSLERATGEGAWWSTPAFRYAQAPSPGRLAGLPSQTGAVNGRTQEQRLPLLEASPMVIRQPEAERLVTSQVLGLEQPEGRENPISPAVGVAPASDGGVVPSPGESAAREEPALAFDSERRPPDRRGFFAGLLFGAIGGGITVVMAFQVRRRG
jgi:hypothetical protein